MSINPQMDISRPPQTNTLQVNASKAVLFNRVHLSTISGNITDDIIMWCLDRHSKKAGFSPSPMILPESPSQSFRIIKHQIHKSRNNNILQYFNNIRIEMVEFPSKIKRCILIHIIMP